ncbi:UMP kinase [Candidatus Palibaumannia cicadellinicola]|uniref:Uridylate kinase n=1 Tax=Candidatus Palibaumannia cicadellinicola TaxID=186490 RepID=A0A0K2BL10_9GAMM|nr:UMP kinase [Candidatus Baumannia cicadellinicola]AKZ66061.1 Uridylate kinase [Candidatus Baumannia cicadellinicola]
MELKPIYQRIIIKLSGESLLNVSDKFGINASALTYIAKEIQTLVKLRIQIGIVIGGGNIFRGNILNQIGINRVVSDHIGMLATIINGLAINNALQRIYIKTSIMSSITLDGICEKYSVEKAINLLDNNIVVIFTAGIGHPFFTTDSAACLRGLETEANVVLKATKVDGVFSEDPKNNPNAILYDQLSYQYVIKNELKIMDLAAFTLARDHNLPIRVLNINKQGALFRVVMGHKEGTLITNK